MSLGRPPGTARPPVPTVPADGPVNGCFNGCGEERPQMLRTYQLVYQGKVAGIWRLCAECLTWGQGGPPNPDPLYVPEEAA